MNNESHLRADQFKLHDLTIEVESIDGHCTCDMAIGDRFYMKGGKLSMPDGKSFCMYAMQSTLPLLPAKQRMNHPADWMETDARVVCPDPACQLVMLINRDGIRTLNHYDVSPINWDSIDREAGSNPGE